MDLDFLGMGDFSLEDMACDVLLIGSGEEASWQNVILNPLGYEVAMGENLEQMKKDAEKCKVISISQLYKEGMVSLDILKEVLKIGKDNQALVCLDPGEFSDQEKALETLKEIGPYIDYFLPNEEEARLLSGEEILPQMAQYFRELGVKNVVITTGMNGCFVKGEEAPFAMGAIWGEKKDLTGVGANFAAGLIHGLFQDWQMKTICEFATGCAAVSATYADPTEGARERKEEIKKILGNPYM